MEKNEKISEELTPHEVFESFVNRVVRSNRKFKSYGIDLTTTQNLKVNPFEIVTKEGLTFKDLLDDNENLRSYDEVAKEKNISYSNWIDAVEKLRISQRTTYQLEEPNNFDHQLSLVEIFKHSLEVYKNHIQPISCALVTVIEIAFRRKDEAAYKQFNNWFEKTYYSNGVKKEEFYFPIIDEAPLVLGEEPFVFLRLK
ncbi:TPA: hypothetical protein QCW96_002214 [Bacillus pacificus]|uniref:hypothetical protein n=1 Tax=Bacillus cereus group TaxID=86661 RepID=UPI003849583A|nr:hypothetical protein [Bacillus pacificus]